MGVWSLQQYFRAYCPDAVRALDVTDGDSVAPFDVVVVDANSVLYGANVQRMVALLRLLRPRKAFILAADEADVGKGQKPKPGKYLTACRYFVASCEYIRGKNHESETTITDQEDYVSPLLLPQARPDPVLAEAVSGEVSNCLMCTVARDVKGPADTKLAAIIKSCSEVTGKGRFCVVSRDNDLLLTAMSAWNSSGPKASAPHILTWPEDDWDTTGVTLFNTQQALAALSPSPTAPPSSVGRDFALTVFLSLGGDYTPGILGGAHYTHLNSLILRRNLALPDQYMVSVNEETGLPRIDVKLLLRLLKRTGIGRDDDGEKSGDVARRWCVSLWASMAAVVSGRVVREAEVYRGKRVSAAAVVVWLEEEEDAQTVLAGGHKTGAEKMVLEIWSTEKRNKNLHGLGELVPDGKRPQRNNLCEPIPPLLEQKPSLYKVRLMLLDALRAKLSSIKAGANQVTSPRQEAEAAPPAPTLFPGFGHTRKTKKRSVQEKDIANQMWEQLGMGAMTGTTDEATKKDAHFLQEVADEKRIKKRKRKQQQKQQQNQQDEEVDEMAQPLKKQKKKNPQAEAAEEKKKFRRAKARAVAKRKMTKKPVSNGKKKK